MRGKFNLYLNIKREAVSAASMVVCMILLVITAEDLLMPEDIEEMPENN